MVDENVLVVRRMPCFVCGQRPVDVHHWRTRGAGGGDELENLVPLCRAHHAEFHFSGRDTFWTNHRNRITTYRMMYGLPPLAHSETLPLFSDQRSSTSGE